MTVDTQLPVVRIDGDPLLLGLGIRALLIVLGVLLIAATPRHLAGLVVGGAGVPVLRIGSLVGLAIGWLFAVPA